jgi:N-acetylmuramoyl-L-alanine amidase
LLVIGQLHVSATEQQLPLYRRVIAIDPGHGGPDPGATRGDLKEKDIVLDLGFGLRDLLQSTGAITYLTRDSDTDLADQNQTVTGGRKRRDILRRVELVNEWQPDAVLSLHVNAIGSSRWRGAQVFYPPDDPKAEELAKSIQKALTKVLRNTNRVAKVGDYRILNDAKCPAVLVEVGFISNPEEAALLTEASYRQKIVWAIYLGLQEWLATEKE